ncbi:biotin/lipoyl-binding carrier protein [uncultured Enterovirga sp.]|uniref:biotin/lipoyl-binding carrier protein n=1 Tax=uncultured Enterovirga sp. TaxID=2026352 RepID=UPI0035CC9918
MATAIKAEVAGTVFELLAQPGGPVAVGDTLLVIESMKMEIPVDSTVTGTVSAVRVSTGDVVAQGQVLVEIES